MVSEGHTLKEAYFKKGDDGGMPSEVYVDDDWAGLPNGTMVGPGMVIGSNAFATIEDGLDNVDPGGTVYVEEGLYQPEQTLLVNKSVTFIGPQANVDPRPSFQSSRTPGSADEAIVDGGNLPVSPSSPIFRIAADDVTINGFEVRNGRTDLIDSLAASPVKFRPYVAYNIIHQATGDEGIQLRNINDGVIEYNYVFDTFGDAINVCCGAIDSFIQLNEVSDIRSPDAAIYVYNATNITIDKNLVENVTVNDGIKLGDSDGTDVNRAVGSVINNVVRDTVEDGISINSSHTIIEGNDVYRSTSTNGAIYLNRNLTDIEITNNCVHDNGVLGDGKETYGIRIGTLNQISTDVHVNDNNIFNNVEGGLIYNPLAPQPPEPLDAEHNWWGSPSGPPPAGPNSVVGFVDYIPFLVEPGPVCLSQPTIEGPGDMVVPNDPGECSANVTYTVTAESPFFPINEISCSPGETRVISPPAYSVDITETLEFPGGETTVSCTVTNTDGNTNTVEFTITVEDREPPQIVCPTTIERLVPSGESGAIVQYASPIVRDNCPGVTYSCLPASGSFFSIGETTVQCTATDQAGNTASCSFLVNVLPYEPNLSVIRTNRVYDWVLDEKYTNESVPLMNQFNDLVERIGRGEGLSCSVEQMNKPFICHVKSVRNGSPGIARIETKLLIDVNILDKTVKIPVYFEDEIALCIPSPLSEKNVSCRVVDIKILNTRFTNQLMNLDLQVCREILVEDEIKLEVEGNQCTPRLI